MQPTMCSRCGKNVAVVFITKIENGQTKNEGLCLKCARELHIKPVDDVIEKMGISDEDLESLSGDMMNALSGVEELLPTDDDGLAYRGIIVRHLVLPGQVENSLRCLDTLADISFNLHISLMAQYYPPLPDLPDQLGRTLTTDEYRQVVDHLDTVGLHRGWVQELDAQAHYRPDFTHQQAFL